MKSVDKESASEIDEPRIHHRETDKANSLKGKNLSAANILI